MKFDERHLIQLAAVVQAGGVTEGAARLGMSQPAVSRTLAMLERRLGEDLFVKGRRPLQPTALGRSLAELGQTMLLASRRATELVEGFRGGRSGLVRIAGTPFFMDALISEVIATFHNAHAEVRVDQNYGYVSDLQAMLHAGRIDLAVCPIDILDEGSGLAFEEILPGRNVVACRSTHPLLARRKLRTSDLLEFPWIAPPPGSPLMADLRSLLLSLGATEIRVRYSGASLTSTMTYLKGTDALTVLPHGVVFAFRKERAITALPLTIPHPERALGLLRLANAPRAPAVEALAKHIGSSFRSLRHLIKRHEDAVIWAG
jgi:DNA-binding transcriptional LysR family regulator